MMNTKPLEIMYIVDKYEINNCLYLVQHIFKKITNTIVFIGLQGEYSDNGVKGIQNFAFICSVYNILILLNMSRVIYKHK